MCRIGKSSLYKQAFKQVTERLCITCGSAVSCNLPVEAILDGAMHLFCGVECETNFCIRANSGAMRRALFRLERGICQTCKLDCHALVGRIRCTLCALCAESSTAESHMLKAHESDNQDRAWWPCRKSFGKLAAAGPVLRICLPQQEGEGGFTRAMQIALSKLYAYGP